jgi:RNA polymerase sigma-70 factor (ECF subfamily)
VESRPSGDWRLEELVEAVRRGAPGAAEELWSSQARRLIRAAVALGVSIEEAEDVVQETLLSAFRSFHRFDRSKASFQVWTHRILVNGTSNWHRARRRLRMALAQLGGQQREASFLLPDEVLAAQEAKRTLDRLTADLSPVRRRVWVMTQVSGLSMRETAEALGMREATVRSHLRHARAALAHAASGKEKP